MSRMIVVAGPPGSGKSSAFPVSSFGVAYFNADDRAAELNGGSYFGIPKPIRESVNREFEAFVLNSIARNESFAIETTLRSAITLEQAQRAKSAGFMTEMRYLALRNFAMHLERVKARADAGGHSASEKNLRQIYEASLGQLPRALAEIDGLWVYDNSPLAGPLRVFLRVQEAQFVLSQMILPIGSPHRWVCHKNRRIVFAIQKLCVPSVCDSWFSLRSVRSVR